MRNILLLFLFLYIANATNSTIISINNNIATIDDIDLPIGKSGIVVRDYNQDELIIAYAVLISKNKVKLKSYSNLIQNSFPNVKIKIKKADKILWGIYDNTKMIIAPNLKNYKTILQTISSKVIHPDILASYLLKEGDFNPSKESFEQVCEKYSIGNILTNIDTKVYDVDCLSFKILGTKTLKNLSKDSTKLPFYTRIKKIKKGIMNLDENMINYNNYYKSLLGL